MGGEQSTRRHPIRVSPQHDPKTVLIALQILSWLHSLRPESGVRKHAPRPLYVCISGPQGAGKTSLTNGLHRILSSPPFSLKLAFLSLDDVYLSYEDQLALSKAHPDNLLLQFRGDPGTHDLPLAISTFQAIQDKTSQALRNPRTDVKDLTVSLPAYEKSAHQGRGDRAPESMWPRVTCPVDIVIFEGWMAGFRALDDDELCQAYKASCDDTNGHSRRYPLEHLSVLNEELKVYEKTLWKWFDCFVHIDAEDYNFSYVWRKQAEDEMKAKGKAGMTDEQIKDFVDRFMPFNELCLPRLRREGFFGNNSGKVADGFEGRHLQVTINIARKMTGHRLI
ncbi:P-loop containing nucleoside triphosphate hydrolase protein [Gonapodya prolifera JEL478]|uniref:p-loop containing nucleoside triphosphate hydrolase protein n=1 Tax=Gonapodya prolifera (strain JEL478) TaxID=1344416 RepID=A0A139A8T0_GONPJ|nr:P-loop containing nucleoside triphosphate hydrolase protein [Gonapodya prolifera JEL478]|eukprot:KXS12793.1 P-loop containing nucleoside triphosphate hydrolase protein [Gonapodya prolifera JEL478]